jgi:choline dehydrogenase-like flavoprotein
VQPFDNDCYQEWPYTKWNSGENGNNPKESVLNKWNQMHEVSNVFVTDGACMTSAACQNPSLIYGFNGSACDYALRNLKGNI